MHTPKRTTAALLAIFLGGIGVHWFYLRRYNIGIAWLLAALALSWTVIVPVALIVVGALQGLTYLTYSQERWEREVVGK